ncbi:MBL fold metallo-hydrolase [Streptomyces sp. MMBL 11-3]|uniref:MBL fold metallo-hydrolase n=1 Tax=Streptomyces sp. MMBL 11-3 TaxID=3382639 RepID=UPI0039B4F7C1
MARHDTESFGTEAEWSWTWWPECDGIGAGTAQGENVHVPLRPVEMATVTTLIDNSCDALLPDGRLVRRWGLAGGGGPLPVAPTDMSVTGTTLDVLRAEHGFSAMVDIDIDGHRRRILFDAGASTDGLIGNLDRLGMSPDTIEAIVLSHGHFDHVTGLHGLVRRLGQPSMPVFLHPDGWRRRRISGPGGTLDLPTPSRAAIEGAGFTVIEQRRPSLMLDGFLLITGEVKRTTDFETGMAGHQACLDGEWGPDESIEDDQAAVFHIRGKGLVILTGCGHAGIINIIRHAQEVTGIKQLHAVLGGLHLRFGPVVDRTVDELVAAAPDLVLPAHCTSWSAQQMLATRLPNAFVPNAVGSACILSATH